MGGMRSCLNCTDSCEVGQRFWQAGRLHLDERAVSCTGTVFLLSILPCIQLTQGKPEPHFLKDLPVSVTSCKVGFPFHLSHPCTKQIPTMLWLASQGTQQCAAFLTATLQINGKES